MSASLGDASMTTAANSPSHTLCIVGKQYRTVQDDEFSQDKSFNFTPDWIGATPRPDGKMWSTSIHSENANVSDAYYADSTQPYFGGYNPFSIGGGALNIKAEPVPSEYAGSSALSDQGHRFHWLSGSVYAAPETYGYVEVSAKVPNLQGFWPSPLWLQSVNSSNGRPPNVQELDVNEMFGGYANGVYGQGEVHQTIHYGYDDQNSGEMLGTKTIVAPNPQANYHTYGVLWTSRTAQFYIDRRAKGPAYPATATGPMKPMISLALFRSGTWSQPPATKTPQTLSVQYFRWYQSIGTSCSPSVL
jgi:hypothetical protein